MFVWVAAATKPANSPMSKQQQQRTCHDEAMDVDEDKERVPATSRKRPNPESELVALPWTPTRRKVLPQGRRVLLAKRNRPNAAPVLVVDTNVLLNQLNAFRQFISGTTHRVVVPYTVINELDGLKNSKASNCQAMNAIKFINGELKLDQSSRLSFGTKLQEQSTKLDGSVNDDRILACCLSLGQENHGSRIILLTNDINLQNKAMIHKVESMSLPELQRTGCLNKQKKPTVAEAVTPVDPDSSRLMESERPAKRIRVASPASVPGPDLKQQLADRLAELIVEVFQRTFGSQWRQVLDTKPESGSLLDRLYVLKKNWIGVFSDHFGRDRNTLQLVTECISDEKSRTADLKNYRLLLGRLT